jgi:sugar lactone lactonase YvrE
MWPETAQISGNFSLEYQAKNTFAWSGRFMTKHNARASLHCRWLVTAFFFPMFAACGGGSGSAGDVPVQPISVSLLAGVPLGEGNQDGPTNTTASFSNTVRGIALTSSGELIIADTGNNLLRKLSADHQTVSTLAGGKVPLSAAFADGKGEEARFNTPYGVAVDAAGNTYVADFGNHLVRKINPGGTVSTLAGQAGVCGEQDGIGGNATLCNPSNLAASKSGIVYVLEEPPYPAKRRIRKVTPAGVVSTPALEQDSVVALTTDSVGTLYVADAHQIIRYTSSGNATDVANLQNFGTEITSSTFPRITSLSIDSADQLIVSVESVGAMFGSDSVISFVRIGLNGSGTTLFSQRCSFGRFQAIPLAPKADGQILSAFRGCSDENPYVQIRSYTQQGAFTVVAGPVSPAGTRDGQGDAARFGKPSALTLDSSGLLYVRDLVESSRNGLIRTVRADGFVSTLGRQGSTCPSLTGQDHQFIENQAPISADGAGGLYTVYARRILKLRDCKVELLIDLDTFFIGQSIEGTVNGLAADRSGNVYVSTDTGVIVKAGTNGEPTLFAGSAGEQGHRDGQGQAARFAWLGNMTIDPAGNLYVIDGPPPTHSRLWKDRATQGPVIRKITPDGLVSTLAGNPNAAPGHADGFGVEARFSTFHALDLTAGIAVDHQGNLYVSDPENSVIRKVTPEGRVSTPIGQLGLRGWSTAKTPRSIGRPTSIAIRESKLYISAPHALVQINLPD